MVRQDQRDLDRPACSSEVPERQILKAGLLGAPMRSFAFAGAVQTCKLDRLAVETVRLARNRWPS